MTQRKRLSCWNKFILRGRRAACTVLPCLDQLYLAKARGRFRHFNRGRIMRDRLPKDEPWNRAATARCIPLLIAGKQFVSRAGTAKMPRSVADAELKTLNCTVAVSDPFPVKLSILLLDRSCERTLS